MKENEHVIRVLIALGMFGATLQAQPANVSVDRVIKADGTRVLAVQNHAQSPLIAYLFWDATSHGRGVVYEDAGVASFKAILPGQQFSYGPSDEDPSEIITLKAALWADGSTYGDPASVQRLLDHRTAFRKTLNSLAESLRRALDVGTGPDELTSELQRAGESGICAAMDREDSPACRFQYQAVIHSISHPPVHPDGSPGGKPMPYQQILRISVESISKDLAREMQF